MNWDEYEAWLTTFTAKMEQPSQAQLDRMRRMLGDVTLNAPMLTPQEFVDRYWSPYRHIKLPDEVQSSLQAFDFLGRTDRETIA